MATSPLRHSTLPVLLAVLAATPSALRAECDVRGSATVREDVIRARVACDSARARFVSLFGSTAPSAVVVLRDDPGYEVALLDDVGVVFWPNSGALNGDAAAADAHWREVLPHEIMHALTMAKYYAGAVVTGHGGYGTALPDWFEEGVAIWGEPEASRAARLAHARRLPAERLDLRSILGGAHPVGGNVTLMAPVPGSSAPADIGLRSFYPQAIAVLSFVRDVGGAAAVRALGRRLAADPANLDALAGLPGLPGDMDGVVLMWDSWIARH